MLLQTTKVAPSDSRGQQNVALLSPCALVGAANARLMEQGTPSTPELGPSPCAAQHAADSWW